MKKSVLIVSACFAVFSLKANELSLSNLNRVKVPRAQKIMNKMDKDNDGRISKQEAKGRLKKQFGKFDTKTSSWILTPANIRKLGGAIFSDFRYDTVFVYHNGADSYYAARGFRGSLRV